MGPVDVVGVGGLGGCGCWWISWLGLSRRVGE